MCNILDDLAFGLLGSALTALDGPWEVCDRNNEEGVAVRDVLAIACVNDTRSKVNSLNRLNVRNGICLPVICNTSESIVPSQERSEYTEITSSFECVL